MFTHFRGTQAITLCLLSSSVVISRLQVALGFLLYSKTLFAFLLMHCCKVFNVHYRLKEDKSIVYITPMPRRPSSMVLNIASISNFLKDVWISSFSFSSSCKVFNRKKMGKKGIFSIVRSWYVNLFVATKQGIQKLTISDHYSTLLLSPVAFFLLPKILRCRYLK